MMVRSAIRGSVAARGDWNNNATCRRTCDGTAYPAPRTSVPSILTDPARGSSSSASTLAIVDLPVPDGPVNPTNSPAGTDKQRPG